MPRRSGKPKPSKAPAVKLPEDLGSKLDGILNSVSIEMIALFSLIMLFTALLPLLHNVMQDTPVSAARVLLFVLQGVGGYALVRFLALPYMKRRKNLHERLDSWIYMGIMLFGTAVAAIGWIFRETAFIATVSPRIFLLSILCLLGGMGIAFKRSPISYFILVSAMGLILADALTGYVGYSARSSLIFAVMAFIYYELSGASNRLRLLDERSKGRAPETDRDSLADYKVTFLRGLMRYGIVAVIILISIIMLPRLLRVSVEIWEMEGYPAMLSGSVEMGTVYIYLLPAALAASIMLFIRTYRLTGKRYAPITGAESMFASSDDVDARGHGSDDADLGPVKGPGMK